MAERAQSIGPHLFAAGLISAAIIALIIFGPLAAVAVWAEFEGRLRLSDWAAIRFTLLQAALSAAFSVLLAIPLAIALSRRRFPGRGVFVALLGAPFILPVLVAVFGILAIFGRAGLVSSLLGEVGLDPVRIYGLTGVVLAHVFLNLPLAARIFLSALQDVPAERYRLAGTLNLGAGTCWRLIDWPQIRRALPGAYMIIFLICLTSFAVALTLGGGPRATTIEVAIYQAFRFDFELGRAAYLALIQMVLSAGTVAIAYALHMPTIHGQGLDRQHRRWDGQRLGIRLFESAVICFAAVFLLLPLAMVLGEGIPAMFRLSNPVLAAAARSVAVALLAMAFAITLSLALVVAARRMKLIETVGYLGLTMSPLVVGTGLFLVLFPLVDPVALALPLTVLVNGIFSVPFVIRLLAPAIEEAEAGYGKLATQLSIFGIARLRILFLPRMRRALGFSAGLAGALSMGDLGVIALFADPERGTLPLQMYRLMAAYRMEDAAGAAVLLAALTFGIFVMFDWIGRGRADA